MKIQIMIDFIKGLLGINSNQITEEEVRALFKSGIKAELLDVRMMQEYRTEHINPCRNIDVKDKEFSKKVNYLDRDVTYVLYCRSGRRSQTALKMMQKMGFREVYSLKGGVTTWIGPKKVTK